MANSQVNNQKPTDAGELVDYASIPVGGSLPQAVLDTLNCAEQQYAKKQENTLHDNPMGCDSTVKPEELPLLFKKTMEEFDRTYERCFPQEFEQHL